MNQNRFKRQKISVFFTLMMIIFLVVLSGCQTTSIAPTETPVTETPVTDPVTPSESVVEVPAEIPQISKTQTQYEGIMNAYIKELPTVDLQNPAAAAIQTKLVEDMVQLFGKGASSKDIHSLYIKGITQLDAKNADKFTAYALSGLRKNSFEDYKQIEKYSNDQAFVQTFFKEAERVDYHYIALNRSVDSVQDSTIQDLIHVANEQGYFIASSEGMLFYLVDFTEFAKYRLYNSPEMAAFIEMQAIDDLDPRTSDAALIIDGNTLAARAYGIEQRLSDFKGTRYEKYMAVMLKYYMLALFFGENNTPMFDYETNRINETSVDLYKNIQTIEGSYIAELIKDYMDILSANDGILDDATREKAMALIDGIYVIYDVDEQTDVDFGQWMSGVSVAQ